MTLFWQSCVEPRGICCGYTFIVKYLRIVYKKALRNSTVQQPPPCILFYKSMNYKSSYLESITADKNKELNQQARKTATEYYLEVLLLQVKVHISTNRKQIQVKVHISTNRKHCIKHIAMKFKQVNVALARQPNTPSTCTAQLGADTPSHYKWLNQSREDS